MYSKSSSCLYADFEKAPKNALEFHFPNITIRGCWFHFRQAVIRRAFSIGLKSKYHTVSYQQFFSMLGALALVPIDQVKTSYEIIKSKYIPTNENNEKCELCVNLLTYFEKQWIQSIYSIFHII